MSDEQAVKQQEPHARIEHKGGVKFRVIKPLCTGKTWVLSSSWCKSEVAAWKSAARRTEKLRQQREQPKTTRTVVMGGTIRLGCLACDRTDFDGIAEMPADWTDIQDVTGSSEESVFNWETHIGICPECQAEGQ